MVPVITEIDKNLMEFVQVRSNCRTSKYIVRPIYLTSHLLPRKFANIQIHLELIINLSLKITNVHLKTSKGLNRKYNTKC